MLLLKSYRNPVIRPQHPRSSIFWIMVCLEKCKYTCHKKCLLEPKTYIFTKKMNWDDRTSTFLNFYIFAKNHDFFIEIMIFWKSLKIPFYLTSESEKMLENDFFDPEIFFPKNIILQLQNGIFTSGIPQILLLHEFFESLMYTF